MSMHLLNRNNTFPTSVHCDALPGGLTPEEWSKLAAVAATAGTTCPGMVNVSEHVNLRGKNYTQRRRSSVAPTFCTTSDCSEEAYLYIFEISEFTESVVDIGQVFASSATGSGTLTFAFDPPSFDFSVNSVSKDVTRNGIGYIRSRVPIDYEAGDASHFFEIALTVTDANGNIAGPASVLIFVSDINDNSPICDCPKTITGCIHGQYTASIDEIRASGPFGVNVVGEDADSSVITSLKYSITDGNDGNAFGIDVRTGEMYTHRKLDFESINFYSIEVKVDDGDLTGFCRINITVNDVNDNPPKFVESSLSGFKVDIKRNVSVGTELFDINALDDDSGNFGNVTYAIVGQERVQTESKSLFFGPEDYVVTIDRFTGKIILARELCVPKIDDISTIDFIVRASDGGLPPLSVEGAFSVNIADVGNTEPPVFDVKTLPSRFFSDGVQAGTIVANFTATDNDGPCNARGFISYTIIDGNFAGRFEIDEKTGVLQLAEDLFAADAQFYTIQVEAEDHGLPNSLKSTAQISVSVAPGPIGLQFAQADLGFRVGSLRNVGDGSYTQDLGLFAQGNFPAHGTLRAAWGRTRANGTIRTTTKAATSVLHAVILTKAVQFDDRRVQVAVQAGDQYDSSKISSTKVIVRLIPDSFLGYLKLTSPTGSCTIADTSKDGICLVTISALPNEWFEKPTSEWNSGNHMLGVKIKVESGVESDYGNVEVIRRLAMNPTTALRPFVTSVLNDVILEFPHLSYHRGQEFSSHVWARATYEINVFTVILDIDDALKLQLPILYDIKRWSMTVTQAGSRLVIGGTIKTTYKPQDDIVTGPEELFSFHLKIADDAPIGKFLNTDIRIELLAQHLLGRVDIRGIRRKPGDDPPRGSFIDHRAALNKLQRSPAEIFVKNDEVLGIFASVDQSMWVNTARITGVRIGTTIIATKCSACPVVSSSSMCLAKCIAASTRCSSSDNHALSVDSETCDVYLDGSEIRGGYAVNVTVTAAGFEVQKKFNIWFPVLPLKVSVKSTKLSPINGWKTGPTCAQQYQSTQISISSNFFLDGHTNIDVFLTELLTSLIVTDDPEVATIQSGDDVFLPEVRGIGEGTANVQVVLGKEVLGSAEIEVAATPVSVVGFDFQAASHIILSNPSNNGEVTVSRFGALKVSATVVLDLSAEGTVVFVEANGITSPDGARFSIGPNDGLILSSSDHSILRTAPDNTSLIVGGISGTAKISALWEPGSCVPAGLGSWSTEFTVEVAPPIGAKISLSTERITRDTSAARHFGVSTSSILKVELLYENGISRDFSFDDRLIVDLGDSNELFNVDSSGTRLFVVPNANGLTGSGQITFKFRHLDIDYVRLLPGINATISVVGLDSIVVGIHPFPTYFGSDSVIADVLNEIEGSNPLAYQNAILSLTATLTDGETFDAENLWGTFAKIETFQKDTDTITTDVLSYTEGGDGLIVSVNSVGVVDIRANLDGVLSRRITVTVNSSPVTVTSLLFVDPLTTLNGIVKKGRQMLQLAATFSDDTKHNSLFASDGTPFLPGLIRFESKNTAVVAVDSTKGIVTILKNHHTNVTINAVADIGGGKEIIASHSFACNLDPDVTDVDLGDRTRFPIPHLNPGEAFEVPLRLNSGSQNIGPFQFTIKYDKDVLTAVDVTEGSDIAAGGGSKTLLAQINDPPGKILIVGQPMSKTQRGNNYHLATIKFKATSTEGSCSIFGTVDNLVEPEIVSGTKNIGIPGRSFVAGNVVAIVNNSGSRRRRDDHTLGTRIGSEHALVGDRIRRADCSTISRQSGDTNGDCVFDIIDAAYTSEFVVESLVDFTGSFGDAFKNNKPSNEQIKNMDADLNGVIDGEDAFYLARAAVAMTRFVKSISFIEVNSSSGCVLQLEAVVLMKGDVADSSDDDKIQTSVYFDIASTNKKVQKLLEESVDDCSACSGKLEKTVDHTGLNGKVYGMLVQAIRDPVDKTLYRAAFQTNLVTSEFDNVGLSLIVVTRDANLHSDYHRVAFLVGPPLSRQELLYDDTIEMYLNVSEDQELLTVKSQGYSPLSFLNNTTPSSLCLNLYTPAFRYASYAVSVKESFASNNTLIVVNASDGDVGLSGVVTYTFSGTLSKNYRIDPVTGMISSTRALVPGVETLRVTARDGAPPFNENVTDVTITVTDTCLVFNSSEYHTHIPENYGLGKFVLVVHAANDDADWNQGLTFSIRDSDGNFTIHNRSGVVSTAANFDFEAVSSFEFVVDAVADAYPSNTNQTLVYIDITDVNDFPPRFVSAGKLSHNFEPSFNYRIANYSVHVRQGLQPGTPVLMMSAEDPEPLNESFSFKLVEESGDSGFLFNDSEVMFYTGSSQPSWMNREQHYNAIVSAFDDDGLTSNASVSITVDSWTDFDLSISLGNSDSSLQISNFGPEINNVAIDLKSSSSPEELISFNGIVAVEKSEGFWYDRPVIAIVIQARTQYTTVPSKRHKVLAYVKPGIQLASDITANSGDPEEFTLECETSIEDGICVASGSIPQAWFAAALQSRSISLSYGPAGGDRINLPESIIHSSLGKNLKGFTFSKAVVLEMPHRGHELGESFRIPIRANGGFSIATWSLNILVSSFLEITELDIDSNVWTAEVVRTNAQKVDIVGLIADESAASSDPQVDLELLGSIVVKVMKMPSNCITSTGINCPTVTCTVVNLDNVKEKKVIVSKPAFFVDRYSIAKSGAGTSGVVIVTTKRNVGVLAAAAKSSAINTARLNGTAVVLPVSVFAVTSYGTPVVRSVELKDRKCGSQNTKAVQVSKDCFGILLDGSETEPSGVGAEVSFGLESLSEYAAPLMTFVWWPKYPIVLDLDLKTLYGIEGWTQNNTDGLCIQVYQNTRIAAFASFTIDGTSYKEVRVTEFITPILKTTDSEVALISDGLIVGINPGEVMLYISNEAVDESIDAGSVSLTVSSSLVEVVSLDAYAVATISVKGSIESPFELGFEPPFVIHVNSTMVNIDQEAGIAAFANFDDGSRMQIRPGDGLRILSKDPSIVGVPSSGKIDVDHSRVIAVGSGSGDLIDVTWSIPKNCSSSAPLVTFGKTLTYVSSRAPPPKRVEIKGPDAHVLTEVGDPLTLLEYVTAADIDIFLVYDSNGGEVNKKMTDDPRTKYDLSEANGIFSVCPVASDLLCNPSGDEDKQRQVISLPLGTGGEGTLTVSFAHTDLVATVKIHVTVSKNIFVRLHPYPIYPGSSKKRISDLRRYANKFSDTPVRQQAIGAVYILTSEDDTFEVPKSASVKFNSYLPQEGNLISDASVVKIHTSTGVVSVTASDRDLAIRDQYIDCGATVLTHHATPVRLRVTDKLASIIALRPPRLVSQKSIKELYNLVRMEGDSDQIILGALFDDGLEHPELLSIDGTPLLTGLLSFTSTKAAAVTVSNSGKVILNANHPSAVKVIVGVNENPAVVSVPLSLACNLLPTVGDIDMGNLNSFPLLSIGVGQEFTVPIQINTGSDQLGAIDLEIHYDSESFVVIGKPNTGKNWAGGVFEAVNDPASGTIKLGGNPTEASNFRGTRAELAVITFRAISSGSFRFYGSILTIASIPTVDNLGGTNIGGTTPRNFIAGNVDIIVSSGRRRFEETRAPKAAFVMSHKLDRTSRSTACTGVLPCKSCDGVRENGDTNGDCVFDIKDVGFVQVYIAERMAGFKSPRGKNLVKVIEPFQKTSLDADRDGEIEASDARFLARVNFDLLRFVNNFSVQPVTTDMDSGGFLTINVSVTSKGGIQQLKDDTYVFLDLSHNDPASKEMFAVTNATIGEVYPSVKRGTGSYGMLVKMYRKQLTTIAPDGSNRTSFIHTTSLNTGLALNRIGASILMVTFDTNGDPGGGRDEFLTKSALGGRDHEYPGKLDFPITITSPSGKLATILVIASQGYSPLHLFDNNLSSLEIVNEHPPWISEPERIDVPEDTEVGTLLFTVKYGDNGTGPRPATSIKLMNENATLINKELGVWSIWPITLDQNGEIRLVHPLDAEDSNQPLQIPLKIEANDHGLPSPLIAITFINITITDVNDHIPVFANANEHGTFMATASYGTPPLKPLITLDATDKDSGNNSRIEFTLLNGDPHRLFALQTDHNRAHLILTQEIGSSEAANSNISRFDYGVGPDGVGNVTHLNLTIRACDGGTPRKCNFSYIDVAIVDEDLLNEVTLLLSYDEFVNKVDNVTSANVCVRDLGKIIGINLDVKEARPSLISPGLTDLAFFAWYPQVSFVHDDVYINDTKVMNSTDKLFEDFLTGPNPGSPMPPTEVLDRMLAHQLELTDFGPGCSLAKAGGRPDSGHVVQLETFPDAASCTAAVEQHTEEDQSHVEYWLAEEERRAKIWAAETEAIRLAKLNATLDESRLNLTVFDISKDDSDFNHFWRRRRHREGSCTLDNFVRNISFASVSARIFCEEERSDVLFGGSFADSILEVVVYNNVACNMPEAKLQKGGPGVINLEARTVHNHACFVIEPIREGDAVVYARAHCDVPITTTTTITTETTKNISIDVTPPNKDTGLSIEVVASVGGGVVCLFLLIILHLYRSKRVQGRSLSGVDVFASSGDILFAPPEKMTQGIFGIEEEDDDISNLSQFSNGTKTLNHHSKQADVLLNNATMAQAQQRQHVRFNPLIGLNLHQSSESYFMAGEEDSSYGEEDSLGDLSDFDEADFEEFADSLLSDLTTDVDESNLFGYMGSNFRERSHKMLDDKDMFSTNETYNKEDGGSVKSGTTGTSGMNFDSYLNVGNQPLNKADSLDSLSDFENAEEVDAQYGNVSTSAKIETMGKLMSPTGGTIQSAQRGVR